MDHLARDHLYLVTDPNWAGSGLAAHVDPALAAGSTGYVNICLFLGTSGDLSKNYKALGEICGLKFQLEYFDLLEKDFKVHPDSHVRADVDALEMKQEYDRLKKPDPDFAAAMKGGRVEAKADEAAEMASAIEWLKQGTEGQRRLAGIFCRWQLNGVGYKDDGQEADQMEKVILHFRNRKLVERILADSRDKIYITYGAHHIRGVIDLLKQKNPAWKVETITWMRPIDMPKHLEGEL